MKRAQIPQGRERLGKAMAMERAEGTRVGWRAVERRGNGVRGDVLEARMNLSASLGYVGFQSPSLFHV